MIQKDPYTPSENTYECVTCSWREQGGDSIHSCPECGAPARNIAVPRE